MDLKTARDEFALRFYQWARDDFRREIREGLQFIASIKGSAALRFIEIWNTLSTREQSILARALLKWAHQEAVEHLGDYRSAEEDELLQRYLTLAREDCQIEREIWKRRFAGQGPVKKINRRRFASLTKEKLKPILGESFQIMGRNDVQFSRTIGSWTVNTRVIVGQPPYYHHRIVAVDHVFLWEQPIDILSWLGIPMGLTWNLILDDDDAVGAAISMATVCAHFMRAVPKLLEGVSHDLPPEEPEPPSPPAK